MNRSVKGKGCNSIGKGGYVGGCCDLFNFFFSMLTRILFDFFFF